MAEAPKSRGFGSLLGRSMGVAVEGIQPEIVRNRATPDAASQSGQPWPDDSTNAPVETLVEGVDDGTVSLVLPDGHLWAVHVVLEFAATVTAAGETRVIRATVISSPDGAWGSLPGVLLPQYVGSHTAIGSAGAPVDMDGRIPVAGLAQGSFTVIPGTAAPGSTSVTGGSQTLSVSARWLRPLTTDEMP